MNKTSSDFTKIVDRNIRGNMKVLYFLGAFSLLGWCAKTLGQQEIEKLFHQREELGEKQESQRIWKKAQEQSDFEIAESYYFDGKYDLAYEYFQKVLNKNSQLKVTYFYLFKILTIKKKYEERNDLMKKFLAKYPQFSEFPLFKNQSQD